jgi:hypothetical protein
MNAEVDLFCWISVDFELQRIDRNVSIRVYGSIHPKAKDIFCGLEGGRNFELPEERPFLL